MAEVFDKAVRKSLLDFVPFWIKPNHLSTFRAILLGPYILLRDNLAVAIMIVCLSSFCGLLDGPLARMRGQVSRTGAILNATSDKIFILGAFCFASSEATPGDLVTAMVVLGVLLTALRPIKLFLRVKMDTNSWGGAKVWLQTLAIFFDLLHEPWAAQLISPTLDLAIICAIGSLCSHVDDMCT